MSPPLILLTGFLGAGKTTSLQTLLAADRLAGRTPGILVNDFGALGIDATLLGNPNHLVSLVDGCLCCSLQDDLLLGVLALLDAGADRLYVEPSGLADPVGILEALAVPDLLDRLSTICCIAITAAASPPTPDPAVTELWEQQLRLADLIVLSHCDGGMEGIALWPPILAIQAINTQAPVLPLSHGIGLAMQLDNWLNTPVVSTVTLPGRLQTLGWHATVLTPDPDLTSTNFDAWLQSLPDTIFRVKGFVHLADTHSWWLIQGVGSDRRRYRWPGDPGEARGIVVIGTGKLEP